MRCSQNEYNYSDENYILYIKNTIEEGGEIKSKAILNLLIILLEAKNKHTPAHRNLFYIFHHWLIYYIEKNEHRLEENKKIRNSVKHATLLLGILDSYCYKEQSVSKQINYTLPTFNQDQIKQEETEEKSNEINKMLNEWMDEHNYLKMDKEEAVELLWQFLTLLLDAYEQGTPIYNIIKNMVNGLIAKIDDPFKMIPIEFLAHKMDVIHEYTESCFQVFHIIKLFLLNFHYKTNDSHIIKTFLKNSINKLISDLLKSLETLFPFYLEKKHSDKNPYLPLMMAFYIKAHLWKKHLGLTNDEEIANRFINTIESSSINNNCTTDYDENNVFDRCERNFLYLSSLKNISNTLTHVENKKIFEDKIAKRKKEIASDIIVTNIENVIAAFLSKNEETIKKANNKMRIDFIKLARKGIMSTDTLLKCYIHLIQDRILPFVEQETCLTNKAMFYAAMVQNFSNALDEIKTENTQFYIHLKMLFIKIAKEIPNIARKVKRSLLTKHVDELSLQCTEFIKLIKLRFGGKNKIVDAELVLIEKNLAGLAKHLKDLNSKGYRFRHFHNNSSSVTQEETTTSSDNRKDHYTMESGSK